MSNIAPGSSLLWMHVVVVYVFSAFWCWVLLVGDAKSSMGDAKSSLGDAKSLLGDAKSSLGDTKSSLGDAKS
jgi:hypothetical protein